MKNLEQKKQLLYLKLKANAQRNARTSYLASLPPALSSYLQTCQFVLSPELDILLPYFGLTGKNTHQNLLNEAVYDYRQFSCAHQVFDVVSEFSSGYDSVPAWFYSKGECPLFHTTFGWVRQNVEALFSECHLKGFGGPTYKPEGLGVITTDFTAGIVIDTYCGYLSFDPSPEEVVYEVATWTSQR